MHSLIPLVLGVAAFGYDITTKTLIGWALGLGLLYLGYRALAAATSATDERDKEKRAEQVKWSIIIFAVGLGIFVTLMQLGLISMTDVQRAMDAI